LVAACPDWVGNAFQRERHETSQRGCPLLSSTRSDNHQTGREAVPQERCRPADTREVAISIGAVRIDDSAAASCTVGKGSRQGRGPHHPTQLRDGRDVSEVARSGWVTPMLARKWCRRSTAGGLGEHGAGCRAGPGSGDMAAGNYQSGPLQNAIGSSKCLICGLPGPLCETRGTTRQINWAFAPDLPVPEGVGGRDTGPSAVNHWW
jgi:hypothetical protein